MLKWYSWTKTSELDNGLTVSCHLAWQHRHDQDRFLHGGVALWYLPCPESRNRDAYATAHGHRVGSDKGLSLW